MNTGGKRCSASEFSAVPEKSVDQSELPAVEMKSPEDESELAAEKKVDESEWMKKTLESGGTEECDKLRTIIVSEYFAKLTPRLHVLRNIALSLLKGDPEDLHGLMQELLLQLDELNKIPLVKGFYGISTALKAQYDLRDDPEIETSELDASIARDGTPTEILWLKGSLTVLLTKLEKTIKGFDILLHSPLQR
ncbi:uncharacterized protein LOC131653986 [Vicia villosa]|uniref:uncharacterized protein LOC131653985 n=1 Tax=Vicia villosa TaxID=3911 RepID=UPI00273ADECD|nr:uncharacterized protein LOC131653985 [Vicia villosa]XP_058780336.1 uncharacterized protein LOC131653986 [Vicia villosa]